MLLFHIIRINNINNYVINFCKGINLQFRSQKVVLIEISCSF